MPGMAGEEGGWRWGAALNCAQGGSREADEALPVQLTSCCPREASSDPHPYSQ